VTGWEKWPGVRPFQSLSSRPADRLHPLVFRCAILIVKYLNCASLHVQVSRTFTSRRRRKAANLPQAKVTAQKGKGSAGAAGSRCCSGPPASSGKGQKDERQLGSDTTSAECDWLLRRRLGRTAAAAVLLAGATYSAHASAVLLGVGVGESSRECCSTALPSPVSHMRKSTAATATPQTAFTNSITGFAT
jgi:hypothetical protein